MAFFCAFGASSPHPAPSCIYPAVSICVFLHAVFACSALRGLLASRLWLAVCLHLSSCPQINKVSFAASPTLLTTLLVANYPPLSLSTSFGHLDLLRKNISSSRPKIPPSCLGPVASLPPTRRASPRLAAIHDSFPPNHSLARTVHRS